MYELVQVGEKTYYIDCPVKMGIYKMTDTDVCLFDSGNDKDAGKKVQSILNSQGWNLQFIINTHSNADHIGGNALLQQRLNVPIYASGSERCFTQYPLLEPSFLYGGYPCRELKNKFLMAQPSQAADLSDLKLPQGLTIIQLPGHFMDMVGIGTDDKVWFLADCIMGENILNKYHISFIYDTGEYLKTLDKVEQLQGRLFIPSHAQPVEDIRPLVEKNRMKLGEILEKLVSICQVPRSFEEVLSQIFTDYQLSMDFNQYVLVGSTIRSHLSWLCDSGKIQYRFEKNRLLWFSN